LKTNLPELRFRVQSLGEEIANSVSHGLGFLAVAAATPFLIISALQRGTAAAVAGVSIFAFTMLLMYLVSSIYHCLPRTRAKSVFRILDHNSIFLLIAGTYTPFLLGVLRGTSGWIIFGLIWGLALVGIVLKSVRGATHSKISVVMYVGMGWLGLLVAVPLWVSMPRWGVIWLLAGGLFYTLGVAFYRAKHIRYAHLIWHLFVLMGTTSHFVAVLKYSF